MFAIPKVIALYNHPFVLFIPDHSWIKYDETDTSQSFA